MNDLTNLKKNAGITESNVDLNPIVAIIPNGNGHADTGLPLDGKTPLYLMRDSDVNGLIISTDPITPELQSRLIKQHSKWQR